MTEFPIIPPRVRAHVWGDIELSFLSFRHFLNDSGHLRHDRSMTNMTEVLRGLNLRLCFDGGMRSEPVAKLRSCVVGSIAKSTQPRPAHHIPPSPPSGTAMPDAPRRRRSLVGCEARSDPGRRTCGPSGTLELQAARRESAASMAARREHGRTTRNFRESPRSV